MSQAADPVFRDATPDDTPAIASLRASEGWGVNEWALHAVISRPDARCIVAATEDGELAGVGSGIVYGPLGFIGNMIVGEGHRRRGIGSAILGAVTQYLEGAGCQRLELNATETGRPLYESHGFSSIGLSATAEVPRAARLAHDPSISTRRATQSDLGPLAAYDRPRFGGDRRALLEMLVADPDASMLLAERHGDLVGFGWVRIREPRVGPIVADEPSIAAALLADAFTLAADADQLRLNLPPGNRPGARWLEGLGVPIDPWDGRMARGPQLDRRDDTIYAMTAGALG